MYEIEKDEREAERFRQELEEKIRNRIEARLALDMQCANNQLKKDYEAAEERAFMEDQIKIFAERDKLDQLSNEKRRRKQLEHKQAIRELMETRRIERAQKMVQMIKETEAGMAEDQRRYFNLNIQKRNELYTSTKIFFQFYRQRLVEEERIKLLKEHAKALIGFLPNGILKELQND